MNVRSYLLGLSAQLAHRVGTIDLEGPVPTSVSIPSETVLASSDRRESTLPTFREIIVARKQPYGDETRREIFRKSGCAVELLKIQSRVVGIIMFSAEEPVQQLFLIIVYNEIRQIPRVLVVLDLNLLRFLVHS